MAEQPPVTSSASPLIPAASEASPTLCWQLSCFNYTIHITPFLPWGFPVPWVRRQWKCTWNAHMHSLEVGDASPPGAALSGGWKLMGKCFSLSVLKWTILRDIFSLRRQFQWGQAPVAHSNAQLNLIPRSGFSSSPSHLFPSVPSVPHKAFSQALLSRLAQDKTIRRP